MTGNWLYKRTQKYVHVITSKFLCQINSCACINVSHNDEIPQRLLFLLANIFNEINFLIDIKIKVKMYNPSSLSEIKLII